MLSWTNLYLLTDGAVELNPTIDFIAGTIAVRRVCQRELVLNGKQVKGIASLVVGFPFDTGMFIFRLLTLFAEFPGFCIQVKVKFQSPAIAGKYHSTFHAITTIIREERFIGLYKGITSPLVI